MKFLLFLVSFYLLMMNVLGAPVHHTTTVTNPASITTTAKNPESYTTTATSPESSVETPPKYFFSVTETISKTFDLTTDSTKKGILFYFLLFRVFKYRMYIYIYILNV